MREREVGIGGKLSIWSAPTSETVRQFSLSVAIAHAAGEARRRSWLRVLSSDSDSIRIPTGAAITS
jgi:hypothetical protein